MDTKDGSSRSVTDSTRTLLCSSFVFERFVLGISLVEEWTNAMLCVTLAICVARRMCARGYASLF